MLVEALCPFRETCETYTNHRDAGSCLGLSVSAILRSRLTLVRRADSGLVSFFLRAGCFFFFAAGLGLGLGLGLGVGLALALDLGSDFAFGLVRVVEVFLVVFVVLVACLGAARAVAYHRRDGDARGGSDDSVYGEEWAAQRVDTAGVSRDDRGATKLVDVANDHVCALAARRRPSVRPSMTGPIVEFEKWKVDGVDLGTDRAVA